MSKRYYVSERQLGALRTLLNLIQIAPEILPVRAHAHIADGILDDIEVQIMAYRPGTARLDKMQKKERGRRES